MERSPNAAHRRFRWVLGLSALVKVAAFLAFLAILVVVLGGR